MTSVRLNSTLDVLVEDVPGERLRDVVETLRDLMGDGNTCTVTAIGPTWRVGALLPPSTLEVRRLHLTILAGLEAPVDPPAAPPADG